MSCIAHTVLGVCTRVQNSGGNCGTNTTSSKKELVARSQNPYELDQVKRCLIIGKNGKCYGFQLQEVKQPSLTGTKTSLSVQYDSEGLDLKTVSYVASLCTSGCPPSWPASCAPPLISASP